MLEAESRRIISSLTVRLHSDTLSQETKQNCYLLALVEEKDSVGRDMRKFSVMVVIFLILLGRWVTWYMCLSKLLNGEFQRGGAISQ
jgi:di/tricarboxylate transporter